MLGLTCLPRFDLNGPQEFDPECECSRSLDQIGKLKVKQAIRTPAGKTCHQHPSTHTNSFVGGTPTVSKSGLHLERNIKQPIDFLLYGQMVRHTGSADPEYPWTSGVWSCFWLVHERFCDCAHTTRSGVGTVGGYAAIRCIEFVIGYTELDQLNVVSLRTHIYIYITI